MPTPYRIRRIVPQTGAAYERLACYRYVLRARTKTLQHNTSELREALGLSRVWTHGAALLSPEVGQHQRGVVDFAVATTPRTVSAHGRLGVNSVALTEDGQPDPALIACMSEWLNSALGDQVASGHTLSVTPDFGGEATPVTLLFRWPGRPPGEVDTVAVPLRQLNLDWLLRGARRRESETTVDLITSAFRVSPLPVTRSKAEHLLGGYLVQPAAGGDLFLPASDPLKVSLRLAPEALAREDAPQPGLCGGTLHLTPSGMHLSAVTRHLPGWDHHAHSESVPWNALISAAARVRPAARQAS